MVAGSADKIAYVRLVRSVFCHHLKIGPHATRLRSMAPAGEGEYIPWNILS